MCRNSRLVVDENDGQHFLPEHSGDQPQDVGFYSCFCENDALQVHNYCAFLSF